MQQSVKLTPRGVLSENLMRPNLRWTSSTQGFDQLGPGLSPQHQDRLSSRELSNRFQLCPLPRVPPRWRANDGAETGDPESHIAEQAGLGGWRVAGGGYARFLKRQLSSPVLRQAIEHGGCRVVAEPRLSLQRQRRQQTRSQGAAFFGPASRERQNQLGEGFRRVPCRDSATGSSLRGAGGQAWPFRCAH
jgi:hypothetical protein